MRQVSLGDRKGLRWLSAWAAWLVLGATLAACSGSSGLAPIPASDRITISEFGKPDDRAVMRDGAAIERALNYANERRKGRWAEVKAAHSACGTVLLTFHTGTRMNGYFGLDSGTFFTNGPKGMMQQPADQAAVDAFMALLPPRYEPSKCLG